jgi:hypothetical protein
VHASLGVDSTPELCMSGRSTSYRVTRGTSRLACFHAPRGLTTRPSSGPFEPDSFSLVWSPLRSCFAVPPFRSFRSEASCQGSVPIRGITGGVYLRGSTPAPATFRPQAFSTSRRFAPPPVLRAYCIPLPRPGFSVQGILSIRSRTGSSPAVSPLPLSSDHSPASRLPWVGRLGFEALLREPKRSPGLVFSLSWSRSPLRFLSSFRLLLTLRGPGSPGPPLVTFSGAAFTRAEARALTTLSVSSVLTMGSLTRPSPVSSTCSRFRAFHGVLPPPTRPTAAEVILTVPPVLIPYGFIFMEPGFVSCRLIRPPILKSFLVKLT